MQDSIADASLTAGETMRSQVALRAAIATLAILTPFLVYHLLMGNWTLGAVILIVMTPSALILRYLRKGGSEARAMHIMGAMASVGVVLANYISGPSAVFWLYPVMMGNFYCLPRKIAIWYNVVLVAGVVPQLIESSYVGLRAFASLVLIFMLGMSFSREVEQQRRQLSALSLTDSLTGLGNRRAMELCLAQVRDASTRYGRPVSLVILDLDHFKEINDRYGHQAGDDVLGKVGSCLRERLRRSDRLFRFGGEEFLAVLPETPLERAEQLAEDLRVLCSAIDLGDSGSVTLSAGVAQLQTGEDMGDWLQRADEALYRAKTEGRNQVVSAHAA